MGRTPSPTSSPPDELERFRLDADRWRLWRTLARGLAHGLANAAQMLALDPTPLRAREEALARLELAIERLSAVHRDPAPGPTVVTDALADLQAMQRLQAGYPSLELTLEVEPGLPAIAMPAADLAHVLLALVTFAKTAAGTERVPIAVRATRDGDSLRLALHAPRATASPRESAPELEAARWLARRAGGDLMRDADAAGGATLRLRVPAWRPAAEPSAVR